MRNARQERKYEDMRGDRMSPPLTPLCSVSVVHRDTGKVYAEYEFRYEEEDGEFGYMSMANVITMLLKQSYGKVPFHLLDIKIGRL